MTVNVVQDSQSLWSLYLFGITIISFYVYSCSIYSIPCDDDLMCVCVLVCACVKGIGIGGV